MTGLYIRYGYVSDQDTATGTVTVTIPELGDGFVSHPLPILYMGVKEDKSYDHVDVNSFVVCLVDKNCETGVVLGGIYDDNNKPDGSGEDLFGRLFKDKTRMQYDRSGHKASIDNDTHDVKVEINGGQNGAMVILQKLVDNQNLIMQNVNTLTQAVSAGLTAVGTSTAASGPAGASAFNTAVQGVQWNFEDMGNQNFKH